MNELRKLVWGRGLALAALAGLLGMALPAPAQDMREVLGGGDTVRITVFRYPDLTTEGRLSDEGTITVPLVGEVSLKGLTPEQAGRHIADRLREGKYLVNPQVGVTVLQTRSRQVSVLGLVGKPGRYPLEGTSARLTDLIAQAGGLQPTASETVTVMTTRGGKPVKIEVDLAALMQEGADAKDVEVYSGDTIYVNRAPVFYIYGEIQRAGAYRVEPGMTIMQAISLAGGITPRGTDSRPQVRRRDDNGQWRQRTASLFDEVRPDDVIFVRESLF